MRSTCAVKGSPLQLPLRADAAERQSLVDARTAGRPCVTVDAPSTSTVTGTCGVRPSLALHHDDEVVADAGAVPGQLPADAGRTLEVAAIGDGRQRHQEVGVVVRHVLGAKAVRRSARR